MNVVIDIATSERGPCVMSYSWPPYHVSFVCLCMETEAVAHVFRIESFRGVFFKRFFRLKSSCTISNCKKSKQYLTTTSNQ